MQPSNTPLTARSVLASTLLGTDPPELSVANLVRIAGLFGINENRARVALSRMVSSGEATTDGAGQYRLSGHLLQRQHRQAASRSGQTRNWSEGWHLVVVTATASAAEVRGRRRQALSFARLAELRDGFWLRPDNLGLILPDEIGADVTMFSGASLKDPKHLAATLWDLSQWAARANDLFTQLRALPPKVPSDLAPGFVLSAAVLRHFQNDPLLPSDLLARSWPGDKLRRTYDGWDRSYRRLLSQWVNSPAVRA